MSALKPYRYQTSAAVAAMGLLLGACSYGGPHTSPAYPYAYGGYPQYSGFAQPVPPPYVAPAPRRIAVNYETFNTLEAPLALDVGGTTLLLRGRADAPIGYSFENDRRTENDPVVNGQISLERQLPNRITVGAVYGAQLNTTPGQVKDYTDDMALFAGGSWGTVFGGNVSNLVRENTRRRRSAVPQQLRGSGPMGEVGDWAGGYQGRYGPVIVSALVDEDGGYDVGATFQRPIGVRDYRLTARHMSGTVLAADGVTTLDTQAVSGVAEYVYGSSRFDVGLGYEEIDAADRWFAGAGAATKVGAWSLSAEGQYGQIEGQDEFSTLVGVRRDLARGISASLAAEYFDRTVVFGGVSYLEEKDKRITATLSYGF